MSKTISTLLESKTVGPLLLTDAVISIKGYFTSHGFRLNNYYFVPIAFMKLNSSVSSVQEITRGLVCDELCCVVLQLSACGILGVGGWLYHSHNGYTTLLPQYALVGADSLLLSIGAALFVVTFFGCCGSWCQSRCLLVTVQLTSIHLHC